MAVPWHTGCALWGRYIGAMEIPQDPEDPRIDVVRSAKRRKTVTAEVRDGRVVVRVPAGLSRATEREHITTLLTRLGRKYGVSAQRATGEYLYARAVELAGQYLDIPGEEPVLGRLAEVRWTAPMRTRWASCTPQRGTIRLSETLQRAPGYVLDYILIHELVHLRIAGHSAEFWRRVRAYPHVDRAHGFLQAWSLLLHDGNAGTDMGSATPGDWTED